MIQKLKDSYQKYNEIIAYLFWGVITTVINIGVFAILEHFTNLNYQVNNLIAWFISVFIAFISNKAYVFHATSNSFPHLLKQMFSFYAGRVLSYGFEVIILWVGISLLDGNEIIVKIIDNIVVIIINYFWSKLAVFKK